MVQEAQRKAFQQFFLSVLSLLGICIGCIIAKTNILVCVSWNQCSNMWLGISVRCWIHFSNILAQFSVPGFMPVLYAHPLLFKETIFPYLIDQATRISLQNQLWNISRVLFIFQEIFFIGWNDPKDVPTFQDFPNLFLIFVLQIS